MGRWAEALLPSAAAHRLGRRRARPARDCRLASAGGHRAGRHGARCDLLPKAGNRETSCLPGPVEAVAPVSWRGSRCDSARGEPFFLRRNQDFCRILLDCGAPSSNMDASLNGGRSKGDRRWEARLTWARGRSDRQSSRATAAQLLHARCWSEPLRSPPASAHLRCGDDPPLPRGGGRGRVSCEGCPNSTRPIRRGPTGPDGVHAQIAN